MESEDGNPIRLKLKSEILGDNDELVLGQFGEVLKAIDIRISSMVLRRASRPAADVHRKNSTEIAIGRARESRSAESADLKQALRRLCISQAAETAAMKIRSSLSRTSEAETIERRYSALTAVSSQLSASPTPQKIRIRHVIDDASAETEETERENLNSSSTSIANDSGISISTQSSSIVEENFATSVSVATAAGTSVVDETGSGISSRRIRPHMSMDARWAAINQFAMQGAPICLESFKLHKRLGCGDIGTVYLAELIGSDCFFALKVMDTEYLIAKKKMSRAQTEREILQMLDHPFLPTLYAHFSTDSLSCLVMEYCAAGDLHVLRQKQPMRRFPVPVARFYVAEVLLALEYLHMLGVIYRDLKPENILVREDGHVMLSDFDLSLRCSVNPMLVRLSLSDTDHPTNKLAGGLCATDSCIDPSCLQPSCIQPSCFVPRRTPTVSSMARNVLKADRLVQLVAEPTGARSNSFVGTHEYLAPEIIRGDGHGSSVDWWTLGILLYELLYGRTPFKGPGNDETLTNVISRPLRFPTSPAISNHCRDLIRWLLVKDPESRLGSTRGAAEIKQHPFFEGMNWALIRCSLPPEMPLSYDLETSTTTQKQKGSCIGFGGDREIVEFQHF